MVQQEAIEFMARTDFFWALRRGFWHNVSNLLRRRENQLHSFREAYQGETLSQRHDLGLQEVAIEKIVGSLGKTKEFDRDFHPRNVKSASRWIGIAKAFYLGRALPAVELYKMGNAYYVIDGHHRISVSKIRGQAFIDAKVIEIQTARGNTPEKG